MSKQYSEEEVKEIWKKVQPTKDKEERSYIQKIETQLKETQLTITKKTSTLYPELNMLKKELVTLKNRVEYLERQTNIDGGEIELITIQKKDASQLIQSYIDLHQGCLTSDIILDLKLDPDLVLEILQELEEKKSIRGKEVE